MEELKKTFGKLISEGELKVIITPNVPPQIYMYLGFTIVAGMLLGSTLNKLVSAIVNK